MLPSTLKYETVLSGTGWTDALGFPNRVSEVRVPPGAPLIEFRNGSISRSAGISGTAVGAEKDAHRGVGRRFQFQLIAVVVISGDHHLVQRDPKQHPHKVIGGERRIAVNSSPWFTSPWNAAALAASALSNPCSSHVRPRSWNRLALESTIRRSRRTWGSMSRAVNRRARSPTSLARSSESANESVTKRTIWLSRAPRGEQDEENRCLSVCVSRLRR